MEQKSSIKKEEVEVELSNHFRWGSLSALVTFDNLLSISM